MSGVREFRREDIAPVAELWLRVYRGLARPAPQALLDYFQLIFFSTPWRDAALPSLVYEEGGRIAGFLGVIPRRMRFRDEPVRVSVVTQLMVDERAQNRYAALELVRRQMACPSDLVYTDGSNDSADRLWRSCGGEVARLFNLNWFRLLRPAQYLAGVARERLFPAALTTALAPACRVADALIALAPGSLRLPERADSLISSEATPESIGWCLRNLTGERALKPDYEPAALHWLLERAGEKRIHGELSSALLRERDGRIAGWYLFYARPGGVAQVLQAGARKGRISDTLHRLFRDARARGAAAITGQLDPRYMRELARAGCRFTWPGYSVLVAASRPELMNAIQRGDAWLTRLEGEWWPRFSDPSWSDPEPLALTKEEPECAASQAS